MTCSPPNGGGSGEPSSASAFVRMSFQVPDPKIQRVIANQVTLFPQRIVSEINFEGMD